MRLHPVFSWVLVSGCLTAAAVQAGSIHIRYGDDVPERMATANVKLYEDLVATRDLAPVKFDDNHPFYGRLLTDPTFADRLVHRWEGHEQRFEYWHNYLWRILDGIAHLPHELTEFPLPVSPPPSPELGPQSSGGEAPAPDARAVHVVTFGERPRFRRPGEGSQSSDKRPSNSAGQWIAATRRPVLKVRDRLVPCIWRMRERARSSVQRRCDGPSYRALPRLPSRPGEPSP